MLLASPNLFLLFPFSPVCSINQSIKKKLQWPKWQQTLQGPLRSHTGESPGNEKQNRCSLRCCLNTVNDEAEVTCSGRVFQMWALATGKAREPTEVSRTVIKGFGLLPEKNCTCHIVMGPLLLNHCLYYCHCYYYEFYC